MEFSTYNILNAAADLIETKGRSTGTLMNSDGQFCPLGAISSVVQGTAERRRLRYPANIPDTAATEAAMEAVKVLAQTINPFGSPIFTQTTVYEWNDGDGCAAARPSDDTIIATIRKAAQAAWEPQAVMQPKIGVIKVDGTTGDLSWAHGGPQ